jgi:amidase
MSTTLYSCFSEFTRVAFGDLASLLRTVKAYHDSTKKSFLIFNHDSGRQVDFDFRGSVEDVLARAIPGGQSSNETAKTGPGRPKLGVKSAEVTLLPRHWEWLNAQPTKASGTLRSLVEEARKKDSGSEKRKIEALGNFLWSIAGNLENFEEASRALYARDWERFSSLISRWPDDLKELILLLISDIRDSSGGGRFSSLRYPEPLPEKEAKSAEPWRLGALELASAIAKGKFSAAEAMSSFIARIKALNPRLNALVDVWQDEAMLSAQAVDSMRARGLPLGPLAGVPFTVKSNIDVAGKPTTHGIAALRNALPTCDAPIVERLRAAGAIPLAHSNMPDLCMRFHTKSQLYGATLNPFDQRYSPGGSSGGEGVAVGTGMSPLGLGNDAGGSLRLPALFSGCAALSPSYGRFPSDRTSSPRDSFFASQVIPVDGLLARSVADLHLAYQLLSGPDPRDPRAVPARLFGPESATPIRVALMKSLGGAPLHADVARALDAAAAALSRAGYEIEEAEPPRYAEALAAYSDLIMSEFGSSRAMLEKLLGPEAWTFIDYSMKSSKPASLQSYQTLILQRQSIQRDWADFLSRRPLILGPVFREPAALVDADIASADSHAKITAGMGLCSVTSFLGLPALALPTGLSGGLPQGVQLIAQAFREDLCLEAGLRLEAALGRIGPVSPGA